MCKRLIQLGLALDEDLVGAVIQRHDDHTGVDELPLHGAQFVLAARVVVNDGDEVVADVPLLLVRLRVLLVARHQGGHVEGHLFRAIVI